MDEVARQKTVDETIRHMETVQKFGLDFMSELGKRLKAHDSSKFEKVELDTFTEYTPKLKETEYGSDEYKEYLKEMQVALDHHYANNRHHPEHHKNGIDGMNLVDVIEMFCDWLAATLRMKDKGDIFESINHNKTRFKMSDQLVSIFINTARNIFGKEEKK